MEFFRIKNDIPFMRHALTFNIISFVTFILAVVFLFTKGLHLSVEFTGGTLIETHYQQAADLEKIRGGLSKAGYTDIAVQNFGSSRDVMIRLPLKAEQNSAKIGEAVMAALDAEAPGAALSRVEFVGPQVGKELALNGLYTLLFVVVGFLIYIAVRFEWKFAVSAIVTTLADVLIVAGFFAASGIEFDLTILAGLLSVMGFSINDKIVVFDRVRENFRNLRAEPMEILNRSINQTLSRTIISSFVAFLTVFALYLYGGGSLEGMALSQMIGIVLGTISSIFVACPLLTIGFLKVTKQDLMPKAKDEALLARRP